MKNGIKRLIRYIYFHSLAFYCLLMFLILLIFIPGNCTDYLWKRVYILDAYDKIKNEISN